MGMASEISRMSFERARHSINQSMSLIESHLLQSKDFNWEIYEDELFKYLTMEICYEASIANPNIAFTSQ